MSVVAIIDYGSGNLHSAQKAFERAAREAGLSREVKVTARPEDVLAADRVVLPGVGAFADCRRGLDGVSGMVEAMEEAVRQRGRPFLGICVGAQLMATRGLEHEVVDGLNWIAGDVAAIKPRDPGLKIPHMGWNTLDVRRSHALLEGVSTGESGLHAYFVHSYQLYADNSDDLVATSDYGGAVTAIVARDNIAGTQFHPEKSQTLGLKLIANFLEWRPVILFPAIDLKDGQCVRLVQGDMTRATMFNADPADQARAFIAQGFDYLHVVDLDGAFAGKPMNAEAVRGILAGLTVKLQLGGGIRDMKTVRGWLESGVTRVIIGTAAVRDPDFVREAARLYPGRIAVGVDAREGIVAIEGWAKTSDISALDLARRFQDAGVAAIIYTDIARDGALAGLNLDSTIALADKLEIPVIASGGLASIEDIRRLTEPDCARLAGAIVGRALYDGRLDPRAALTLLHAGGRSEPSTRLPQ